MRAFRFFSERARARAVAATLFGLAMLPGCGMGYLLQAGAGQYWILNHARPIDEVVRDERTPTRLKSLLARIPGIKAFGATQGLKPTRNYTEYVALDRPAAVWVVSACEKLKFKSKEWWFPIVGTIPYLGWFDRARAESEAGKLRAQGWDVDLRGAAAYSTLGWFHDPVFSSMIGSTGELANVVLHESVHATVYLAGQSYFNESLANYVAGKLTDLYLERSLGPASAEQGAYDAAVVSGEARMKLMHEAYGELEKIYSSSKTDAEKTSEKEKIYAALKEKLQFRRQLNNATLVQFKTYTSGTAGFEAVLKACGGDWPRFMARIGQVKAADLGAEQQQALDAPLEKFASQGCG